MANERRFVFVVTGTFDEVLEGTLREVRAEDEEDALMRFFDVWGRAFAGARVDLIGERRGLGAGRRFYPLVPIHELPDYVRQNENVIGDVREAS